MGAQSLSKTANLLMFGNIHEQIIQLHVIRYCLHKAHWKAESSGYKMIYKMTNFQGFCFQDRLKDQISTLIYQNNANNFFQKNFAKNCSYMLLIVQILQIYL